MHGKLRGHSVTGLDKSGAPRSTYLYHVVDNAWSMREDRASRLSCGRRRSTRWWLELLASGAWQGRGALGTGGAAAEPFLELLTAYGSPWGMQEK